MPPSIRCGHAPRLRSSILLRLVSILLLLIGVLTGCDAAGGAAPASPTAAVPTALVRGADLFARYCQVCHPGGRQGVGPRLIATQLSNEAIKTTVRQGKKNMPPFGPDLIAEAEMQSLVDYIRSLK